MPYSFVGEEYQINDIVCFIKNVRTGSSTCRKIQFIGKVIYADDKKVKLITTDGTHFVVTKPDDIICRINIKGHESDYKAIFNSGVRGYIK